ncbi:DUF697 domain-containing protein [Methylotuvimicrobium sp. KM1]|uniref:DUF697 domain-containing protein n=1 Tax=Methylotuvimicrobium sp. KM1 TaxID=3377707 RepID=UPI0038504640
MTSPPRRPGIVNTPADKIERQCETASQKYTPPRRPIIVTDEVKAKNNNYEKLSDEEPSSKYSISQASTIATDTQEFGSTPWRYALYATMGLVTFAMFSDWCETLWLYAQTRWWYAAVLAFLSVTALLFFWHAVRFEQSAARRLEKRATARVSAATAIERNDLTTLRNTLSPILTELRPVHTELIASFEKAQSHTETARDWALLFEDLVLREIDRQCHNLIAREYQVTTIALTVAPHPALDAMVAIWRAKQLVRSISILYGLSPTAWSSWRLLRNALTSASLAAGISFVSDVALDGAKKIAGNIAQVGLITLRLERLGKLTIVACRPIPPQR